MKKILVAVAISMLASTAAFAGITNTKHDLSSGSDASIKGDTSQICAFCHTPHNATVNVPLWNRSNPDSGTYKLYTSSATLTGTVKSSSLSSTSLSLLCLSCHDGTVDQLGSRVVGKPADAPTGITMTDGTAGNQWLDNGAMLGSDLTNDHPIGFSYDAAQLQDTTGLNDKTSVNTNIGGSAQNAFYGPAKDLMECSSCHLVHDNTNAPFLRKTNAGSQLCLACHSK